MRHIRCNEPRDPELFPISKVVPDRWLDEQWPQKCSKGQGRWQGLRTSQLVRAHLLCLLKRQGSFNRLCRELKHNIDFQRFCRLMRNEPPPTAYALSAFRTRLGQKGWLELHTYLIGVARELLSPPILSVVLIDASDMPGAIRKSGKKKMARRCRNEERTWVQAKERGRRKADNLFSLKATKSTPCMGLLKEGGNGYSFRFAHWRGPQTPLNNAFSNLCSTQPSVG
jgi:hypothetical protein